MEEITPQWDRQPSCKKKEALLYWLQCLQEWQIDLAVANDHELDIKSNNDTGDDDMLPTELGLVK